ncbi:hypothetical protein [Pelagibaculum spongiae]|uniref:hypothetical protein n=1 Tax=Pelagibaculum spongiae TaxID=2080658 RepID=UPI0010578239|nr:hypothetical protein [Pelagibaculum spongiae]
MEVITVYRDDDLDIKFTGELLASVKSCLDRQSSSFSGSVGRWSTLTLYKTQAGKYVGKKMDESQWIGEKTNFSAAVFDDQSEIFNFFGSGWLAGKRALPRC